MLEYNRAEAMCKHIAEYSLAQVRKYPRDEYMNQYYDGRASACALVHPCVETLSAKNEIRFLVSEYARRHRNKVAI